MTTIPQLRDEMTLRAAELAQAGLGDLAQEIGGWVQELYRRPYVRRAPARRSRPDTAAVRAYAAAYPDADYVEIAAHFDANTGRISEALAGYRE